MAVDYEVKDGVIRINAKRWAIEPSIEDSEACMGIVVDILKEVKAPEKLIISEIRDREYDYPQLKLLIEIANAQRKILEEEKLLSIEKFGPPECETIFPGRLAELTFLVTEVLRKDPIRAYFTISRKIKEITARIEKGTPAYKRCATFYLKNVLEPMEKILSRCEIIAYAKPFLPTYRIGDRTIYRELFHPTIRPPFMLTSFKLIPPKEATLIEKYNINDITVEIWRIPGGIRDFYYIIPPEFRLSPEKYSILDVAYRTLVGRRPPEEIAEPERAREIFFGMGVEIVRDLAERMGIKLTKAEIEDLARILVRYTAGFGVLELLLADEKIQDVYINSPIGTTPIYVVHSDFEECETNLIPSKEDAEAWATRFRLYSGRPLDEANPVLDTELAVPGGRARVCAITRPLSPLGLAFSFRRHREKPWTFPLFIKAKMIDPLFAGLMNFIVQGGRSILIAGGRGSGKTSLLNSLMLEILRKYRVIVIEDTLELAVDPMRKLGYNIERMKTRSVITRVEAELPPEEALRTGLRLGESVLIVGEVRGQEALALFEAMRIGALANVVAGTIHAESPYGVYDRIVHDLGVPPTSFKACDLIVICSMLRSPDGLHRFRRVVELTEVRKAWREDPEAEGGFVPLMQYSAKEDKLKPTDILVDGESWVLNEIIKKVREWRGAWDLVWDNILLRSKIKETMVDFSLKLNRPEILEADWSVEANEMFHLICDKVREEVGSLDSKLIYERWLDWFKERLR
jgi:type IV secretory pathway ATPase VirB11/archaellum biosynthesis ATPase